MANSRRPGGEAAGALCVQLVPSNSHVSLPLITVPLRFTAPPKSTVTPRSESNAIPAPYRGGGALAGESWVQVPVALASDWTGSKPTIAMAPANASRSVIGCVRVLWIQDICGLLGNPRSKRGHNANEPMNRV